MGNKAGTWDEMGKERPLSPLGPAPSHNLLITHITKIIDLELGGTLRPSQHPRGTAEPSKATWGSNGSWGHTPGDGGDGQLGRNQGNLT